jgi:DNA-binding response OmpR family regulator
MKRAHALMELVHGEQSGTASVPPIVLIVDDHDETLDLYDTLLSGQGYWVARAANGLEALEYAQDLQPNAVVTDVGLPGDMDGTDLIRELRADSKLSNVPVLVVTGRSPRDLPSFAGLPISGLLLKPVAPDTLVARLQHILQSGAGGADGAVGPSESGQAEQSPKIVVRLEGITSKVKVDRKSRLCPQCGAQLTWTETRRWQGMSHDYYRPCTNGCGLSCFNRDTQMFELLIKSDD